MNIVGTPYRLVQRSSATRAQRRLAGRTSRPGRPCTAPWVVAPEVADHHPEAVVQRHRDADPVALGVAEQLADEVGVVEDVVVGERRALREAGGAARVLDVDRVVEVERGAVAARTSSAVGADRRTARPTPALSKKIARSSPGRLGADVLDHRAEVGALAARAPRSIQRHPDWPSAYSQLAGPVRRVDVDEDHAELRRRVLDERPLGAVRAPHPDAVALAAVRPRASRPPADRPRRRAPRTCSGGPGGRRRARRASGTRATVRSRLWPIVSPSSGCCAGRARRTASWISLLCRLRGC